MGFNSGFKGLTVAKTRKLIQYTGQHGVTVQQNSLNISRNENQKTYPMSTGLIKNKMLSSLGLWLVKDVSGETTCSIFHGQVEFFLDGMNLEDRIGTFSRNVGNEPPIHAAVTCIKSEVISRCQ